MRMSAIRGGLQAVSPQVRSLDGQTVKKPYPTTCRSCAILAEIRMGKPATLLEGLCGHALSLGAQSIGVEYKDRRQWVFAYRSGIGVGIANYASSSADAKELLGDLSAAAKKPVRTVIGGQLCILKVPVFASF